MITAYCYSHCGRTPDGLFEDHYVVFLMDKPVEFIHAAANIQPMHALPHVFYLHSVGVWLFRDLWVGLFEPCPNLKSTSAATRAVYNS